MRLLADCRALLGSGCQVYFSAIDGLKKLYKSKIQPIEKQYLYATKDNSLNDAEFDAKPQVMLLGQYSVGKSTFIKYLLEQDYPGSHIGPEPTTDRFMAVMHGSQERRTPGNAVAVSADKPFRGLTQVRCGRALSGSVRPATPAAAAGVAVAARALPRAVLGCAPLPSGTLVGHWDCSAVPAWRVTCRRRLLHSAPRAVWDPIPQQIRVFAVLCERAPESHLC